jgi:hypothetical protein
VDLSGTSGTITIDDVGSITSAFIRITNNTRHNSGGPTGNAGNQGPDDMGVRLEITGTTTVSWNKQLTGEVKIRFEVWVYVGDPGGPYEFISRQRGNLAVSGASASASLASAGIVDRNKCIPFHNGFTTAESSNANWESATLALHINTSNQVVFSRNNSVSTVTAAYDVVEFTGSAWRVGCARSAAHSTNGGFPSAGEEVTINADSDGTSGAAFDTTNWDTAMIINGTMEGDTAETGLSDTMIYILPGGSTNTVRFVLDNSASRNDGVAYAYVLQADLLYTVRTTSGVAEGSPGVPINFPGGVRTDTALNKLSLEWFPGTNGEGTAHGRGSLAAIITQINPTTGTGGPEEGFVPTLTYSQNDAVDSIQYDSSLNALFGIDITFAATPSGTIWDAGGTGTGGWIGFNQTTGDFVARWGDGSALNPPGVCRLVVPDTTFDFSNRSGRLWVQFDVAGDTIEVWFTETGNVDYDYNDSVTNPSVATNWSGSDPGGVGFASGSVNGSEVTPPSTFNGTIDELRFYNGPLIGGSGDAVIDHWVHRTGNTVKAVYGITDVSRLVPFVQAKRWDGATWANVNVNGWTGTEQRDVVFWDGTFWRPQIIV